MNSSYQEWATRNVRIMLAKYSADKCYFLVAIFADAMAL
jgi:hypothetical protein